MPLQAHVQAPVLSDAEFQRFRTLIRQETGISLSDLKKTLVASRLASRLRHRQLDSYGEYYKLIAQQGEEDELQAAIDLMTTNETSFFREIDHFRILRDYISGMRPVPRPFRVWSAASSSGEEAYTLAMVLADVLPNHPWEIVGTDISTRVLARARRAVYPMERSGTIPPDFLKRFCLKGRGHHEGFFLIARPLRERVQFHQVNLCRPLPNLGQFDLIFLRNLLIYFDAQQKRLVVEGVLHHLKPEGLLMVGHSESLAGVTDRIVSLRPTVYRHA